MRNQLLRKACTRVRYENIQSLCINVFQTHFCPRLPPHYLGIDDPYEEPDSAEVVMDAYDASGKQRSPEALAAELLQYLERQGYLQGS